MSRFLLFFLSLLLIGGGIASAIGGLAVHEYFKQGPLAEEKLVLIDRGFGVNKIADTLYEERIIRHPLLFKVAARLTGQHASLKAGEYQFEPGISMAQTLAIIQDGTTFQRKITLPEGLTSYQIVKRLNAIDALEGHIETIPPEGSLLPETYTYMSGDSKQEKIDRMQEAMIKTIDTLWENRTKDLPFSTKAEALILASIVEKETSVPEERERVAGVFVNRLKKGMPLQTDPTVIYALTKGKVQDDGKGPLGRRLLRKDLTFDSPYNTYVYTGLPPGPIANPGKESIAATLNPEQHDYIFFVADGTGGHVFAKTLSEHNRNVAKWRKIRRNQ